LRVAATARATTVQAQHVPLHVSTVEHAFAALAGLGIREGVTFHVEGPEMPLLDGAALAWCQALQRLGLAPARRPHPRLRVTRLAHYDLAQSHYELSPASTVDVSVCADFKDARLIPDARWQGAPLDFLARIASARTFALARDVEELARQGLARHVDPQSVVVLAPEAIHSAGPPFSPDEPARHKLLDLLGDLYLHGGPPLGRVHAVHPGHGPNHQAIERALEEGVLAPD
jgi:UDP-3-O-[3-hydroxymyristoyl] N-acetylglucosamine deacetylase